VGAQLGAIKSSLILLHTFHLQPQGHNKNHPISARTFLIDRRIFLEASSFEDFMKEFQIPSPKSPWNKASGGSGNEDEKEEKRRERKEPMLSRHEWFG
jgi:hypothetical protein